VKNKTRVWNRSLYKKTTYEGLKIEEKEEEKHNTKKKYNRAHQPNKENPKIETKRKIQKKAPGGGGAGCKPSIWKSSRILREFFQDGPRCLRGRRMVWVR